MQDVHLNQSLDSSDTGSSTGSPAFAHIRFHATLTRPDPSLLFLGPTLRGAFGYALKAVACSMPHGDCSRCILRTECAFPRVFNGDTDDIDGGHSSGPRAHGQPFALEVAPPGTWWGNDNQLAWGIRLFGDAHRWLPHIVAAYVNAGEQGLGSNRTRYEIDDVFDAGTGTVLWKRGDVTVGRPVLQPLLQADKPCGEGVMRWNFRTPTLLTRDGAAARLDDGLSILLAGRRRFQSLMHNHGWYIDPSDQPQVFLDPSHFQTLSCEVRPWKIERYSGRQQRRVPLAGSVGEVRIRGPWHLAGDWLHAAEQMHLGKYPTFGFGRVSWEFEG